MNWSYFHCKLNQIEKGVSLYILSNQVFFFVLVQLTFYRQFMKLYHNPSFDVPFALMGVSERSLKSYPNPF